MKTAGKSANTGGAGKSGLDPIVQYFMRDRGNAYKLAKALNISPQAVYQWERTPVSKVLEVSEITGISRHKLRPDIYPES